MHVNGRISFITFSVVKENHELQRTPQSTLLTSGKRFLRSLLLQLLRDCLPLIQIIVHGMLTHPLCLFVFLMYSMYDLISCVLDFVIASSSAPKIYSFQPYNRIRKYTFTGPDAFFFRYNTIYSINILLFMSFKLGHQHHSYITSLNVLIVSKPIPNKQRALSSLHANV